MQRLEARQLKCFSLSLWTSPGSTKTHPNKQPPKRSRKSKTIGQKQGSGKKREAIWVEGKNGWNDIERKEVKKRHASFGWKKLGRLHVNGLLKPTFLSLNHQPLAPRLHLFTRKIGSGFPGMTSSTRWNQPTLISVVPSLREEPQNQNTLGSESWPKLQWILFGGHAAQVIL